MRRSAVLGQSLPSLWIGAELSKLGSVLGVGAYRSQSITKGSHVRNSRQEIRDRARSKCHGGGVSIVHSVGILDNPGHLPRGNITLGILGPLTSITYEPRK